MANPLAIFALFKNGFEVPNTRFVKDQPDGVTVVFDQIVMTGNVSLNPGDLLTVRNVGTDNVPLGIDPGGGVSANIIINKVG